MNLEARMALEPTADMAMLAGGPVVPEEMDIQCLGRAAVAGAQAAQACGAAMVRAAWAEDRAPKPWRAAHRVAAPWRGQARASIPARPLCSGSPGGVRSKAWMGGLLLAAENQSVFGGYSR